MSRIDARHPAGLTGPAYLALGAIGFIATAPALAQDAAPSGGEKRLGGMTVTDTAIDEEGYKAERIESPKAVAPLLDTPRSIVVVDKQVIKDTGSATLVDALRTVPGITFGAAEGLPGDSVLAILRDRRQVRWVGTNNGIISIAPDGANGILRAPCAPSSA